MRDLLFSLDRDGSATELPSLNLRQLGAFTEVQLRDLVFANPRLLVADQIDPTLTSLYPVCTELEVGSGRLDALFIDSFGRPLLVECKLWRNPESRRKVVAQILEYAAELNALTYSDLQRQVCARLGREGNVLFEIARQYQADLDEAEFGDRVSRALDDGDFSLIIIGDGIRREAHRLVDYLAQYSSLHLRLGLVEASPYRLPNGDVLIRAHVQAQITPLASHRLPRRLTQKPTDLPTSRDSNGGSGTARGRSPEVRDRDRRFWTPFLQTLRLHDPEQFIPQGGPVENRRFPLPAKTWLTAFRAHARPRVGVPFRTRADAEEVWETLEEEKDRILGALPADSEWEDGSVIVSRKYFDDIDDESTWPAQQHWLQHWLKSTLNSYVDTLRPILSRLE